eukprot:2846887-Prymnesium_polylepis.1
MEASVRGTARKESGQQLAVSYAVRALREARVAQVEELVEPVEELISRRHSVAAAQHCHRTCAA